MTGFTPHQHCVIFMWGFIATCAMACLQEGTQALGLSRMSFPFLIGTFFTGNRRRAEWLGFLVYIFGGWIFAAFYVIIFKDVQVANAAIGALMGLAQGLFMLLVLLPLLPCIHPRMTAAHDGPTATRRIEPPGFMALHYGRRAPVIHLLGQMAFGAILGAVY
jgi:hypothetical protein